MESTASSLQHQMHCQVGAMADTGATSSSSHTPLIEMPMTSPRTPPDQASLQSSMDKNKESLKRKLMLRRSVNELVDRGIYPPLKTPPAFAEKTKQLERAKTGDLLRHKIQHRPDRQALVQQHILEDTTIDPSLHERQRLLKRSRLLDGLNDKLAHRPGPLELVQGNILQPSNELANAIKDGTIQFVPTCDMEDGEQSHSSYVFDEESAGSEGAPSPQMDESSGFSDVSSPSSTAPITPADSFPISLTFPKSFSIPVTISKSQQIPLVSSGSSFTAVALPKQQIAASSSLSSSHSSTGKPRSKKLKSKTTSKARIIKFHEYKGPPSVVKSQSSNSTAPLVAAASSTEDTPYHIMLQQQQLFLQWQLEFQQKQQQGSALSPGGETATPSTVTNMIVTSPVISSSSNSPSFIQPLTVNSGNLMPAVTFQQPLNQTVNTQTVPSPSQIISQMSPNPPAPPPPPPPPPPRPTQSVTPRTASKALTSIPANALSLPKLTGNLEEMKVADLKAELKKRSLPVSGPKPQLIERLKPFTESINPNSLSTSSLAVSKSSTPSRVTTPLQFTQTTFQIKQEPNADATSSVVRPIPSTAATPVLWNTNSSFQNSTMPITLSNLGLKTVVSVKPMIKEEPMATTDISPPDSPQIFPSSQGPRTPMTPDYNSTSPPPLKMSSAAPSLTQGLLKSSGQIVLNACHTVMAPGQTVVSMSTDHTQPSSVVPAEMMPMEVDSVSVDLNQGVDDTAFKAASLGHSLDSVNFKTLIQPISSNYKTISLSALDSSPVKINTNVLEGSSIKTVNLSPNFDVKTVGLSPNSDSTTIKTVNLGANTDSISPIKTFNLSPNAEMSAYKTVGVNASGDSNSLLKTMKVPLSQLSPTQLSSVQLAAPLTQTLTSPTSLLQLQQFQQLQALQQLLQQTQAQQLQQQALQQSNSVTLTANDHVVLAQAKQIEELQRQLQESHLKLKLHQLQQQQMQLQQQQQQMWQVRIPSNFSQNSLLTKLSQEQLAIPQQIGQVLTGLPQQPASIFLNGHSLQQAPILMSGLQGNQQHKQPSQAVSSSSSVSTAANNINMNTLVTTASDNNLLNMVTSASGQPAVSLPYAIHINLTSTGQVKLPSQLQPITTVSGAAETRSQVLPSLQVPAQLLLNAQSQGLLNTQPIKTEPITVQAMGPPATTSVMKSQVSNSQSFATNSVSSSLITQHSNGIITRTASLPTTALVTDQPQKVTSIQRCTSNPFFNGPFKEPPRYDEAIKIKQQQTAPSLSNTINSTKKVLGSSTTISLSDNNNINKTLGLSHAETDMKSQAMDDVLEILIRNGDLPPSAATEPLPPPKMSSALPPPAMSSSLTSTPSPVTQSTMSQCHSPFGSNMPSNQHLNNPSIVNSPRDQTLTSVHTSMFADSLLNDACSSSPTIADLNNGSSLNSHSDSGEYLDWGEMLPSPDLSNMDWSSEPGFSHLDLGDSNLQMENKCGESLHGSNDQNSSLLAQDHYSSFRSDPMDSRYNFLLNMDHLSPPYKCSSHLENDIIISSGHSNGGPDSEPDLTVLGLGGDSSDTTTQMDMSDWLDVIMPNTSLPVHNVVPVTANVSFTADPILTPRSQQEVFDIFNFDDSDFIPPAIGIN